MLHYEDGRLLDPEREEPTLAETDRPIERFPSGWVSGTMPKTSLQLPGLRIFFYSGEHDPRHVHVTNGQSTVVFEFDEPTGPLRLRTNHGFPRHEVNRIGRLLSPHVAVLWADWNEHFGFEDEEDGDA